MYIRGDKVETTFRNRKVEATVIKNINGKFLVEVVINGMRFQMQKLPKHLKRIK